MVLSMDRWVGKVAVVTGASSGIGAAIATQLVNAGVIVAGIARRSEKVEELSRQLSDSKGKLHAVKADITKDTELLEAFAWIEKNLGPVSILVNNAGVGGTGLAKGDPAQWRAILELNVVALSLATREAIRQMTANKIDGHIIHINSIAGHQVPAALGKYGTMYPASKFAVTALADTLRMELTEMGSKIKVTSVSPGLVETEMTTLRPNATVLQKAYFEGKAILRAEDIADGVVYVLSTADHVQVPELTIRPVGEGF